MKKFLMMLNVLITSSLLSCELTNTSPLNIKVSQIPPEVIALHVAVFNGDDVIEQVSMNVEDLNTDGSIELYVSSGKKRQVVMIAECDDPDYGICADYYSEKTLDISSGKQITLELIMKRPWWEYGGSTGPFFIDHDSDMHILSWDAINIPRTSYIIQNINSPYNVFYQGSSNVLNGVDSAYSLTLTVEFTPFNLKTRKFDIYIGV